MNRAQRRKLASYKFSQALREGYAQRNLEMLERREIRQFAKSEGLSLSDKNAAYLLEKSKAALEEKK